MKGFATEAERAQAAATAVEKQAELTTKLKDGGVESLTEITTVPTIEETESSAALARAGLMWMPVVVLLGLARVV